MNHDEINRLVAAGRPTEAAALCRPVAVDAVNTEALVRLGAGDYETAGRLMRVAMMLDAENIMNHSNLGYILGRQHKWDEALSVMEAGLGTGVPCPELWYNYGVVLADLGRDGEAIAAYRSALALRPDYAAVRFNLGNLLIKNGQYREGLREYEWRHQTFEHLTRFRQRYAGPDWAGAAGQRVLLVNEQGTGDAVQFVRYVPRLKAAGATVVTEVQSELVTLFEHTGLFDAVIGRTHQLDVVPALPPYDSVLCYSSLPLHFDPDLNSIPASGGYLKPAGKAKTKALKPTKDFKVGIVWAGSPWHSLDAGRSMPVRTLLPLAQKGVKLYSFQTGSMERAWPSGSVYLRDGFAELGAVDLEKHLTDFNATAHLLKKMDLVVTVDTTVAHLGGALGVPTFIMLPFVHDWRWFTSRTDSPWYESVKLFVQDRQGDWGPVVAAIAKEIACRSKKQSGA